MLFWWLFITSFLKGAISVFFTYPLELLRVRMAFDTIHNSASGKPVRPSCLRTARLIFTEGSPQLSAAPITRELFHSFPLLKFYRGFTVSLAGIVPYAGTAFLTWGYLRATFIPVAPNGRPQATPLADLGIGALSPPSNLAPLIIGIWMVAGIALLIYFAVSKPERITDTGRIFLEDADVARAREERPART